MTTSTIVIPPVASKKPRKPRKKIEDYENTKVFKKVGDVYGVKKQIPTWPLFRMVAITWDRRWWPHTVDDDLELSKKGWALGSQFRDASSLTDQEQVLLFNSLITPKSDTTEEWGAKEMEYLAKCSYFGRVGILDIDVNKNHAPEITRAAGIDAAQKIDKILKLYGMDNVSWFDSNGKGGIHGALYLPDGVRHPLAFKAVKSFIEDVVKQAGIALKTTTNWVVRVDTSQLNRAPGKRGSVWKLVGKKKRKEKHLKCQADIYDNLKEIPYKIEFSKLPVLEIKRKIFEIEDIENRKSKEEREASIVAERRADIKVTATTTVKHWDGFMFQFTKNEELTDKELLEQINKVNPILESDGVTRLKSLTELYNFLTIEEKELLNSNTTLLNLWFTRSDDRSARDYHFVSTLRNMGVAVETIIRLLKLLPYSKLNTYGLSGKYAQTNYINSLLKSANKKSKPDATFDSHKYDNFIKPKHYSFVDKAMIRKELAELLGDFDWHKIINKFNNILNCSVVFKEEEEEEEGEKTRKWVTSESGEKYFRLDIEEDKYDFKRVCENDICAHCGARRTKIIYDFIKEKWHGKRLVYTFKTNPDEPDNNEKVIKKVRTAFLTINKGRPDIERLTYNYVMFSGPGEVLFLLPTFFRGKQDQIDKQLRRKGLEFEIKEQKPKVYLKKILNNRNLRLLRIRDHLNKQTLNVMKDKWSGNIVTHFAAPLSKSHSPLPDLKEIRRIAKKDKKDNDDRHAAIADGTYRINTPVTKTIKKFTKSTCTISWLPVFPSKEKQTSFIPAKIPELLQTVNRLILATQKPPD